MAGSGIRGQFEEKFRNLLQDIEAEVGIRLPKIFIRSLSIIGRKRHLFHR
jgi:hypothetical protein